MNAKLVPIQSNESTEYALVEFRTLARPKMVPALPINFTLLSWIFRFLWLWKVLQIQKTSIIHDKKSNI